MLHYGKIAQLWKKFADFFKEFSKKFAENQVFLMELAFDYQFTLNEFKISWKQCDFSVKILNFLWRSGGFAPYPNYVHYV